MPQMRDFYAKVTGAHVVVERESFCLMTFDDEHHRIAFSNPPFPLEQKSISAAGLHHSAYTFPHIDALLEHYSSLAAQGIRPSVPAQHGVTTSLYYLDPDANFIELQVDNFATADEATAYMLTEEYANDVGGPTFDPELMIEARRNGEAAEKVCTREWARSGPPRPGVFEAFAAALADYADAHA
ncbi:putative biphenyl-2,3-diol 1,2-dioxygenase III [Mycobacterium saskatchewanense]|nr:putative biphenyl-2,3-diol 1,2-dioxygenase III [Mycobacterium saskatchewanense]